MNRSRSSFRGLWVVGMMGLVVGAMPVDAAGPTPGVNVTVTNASTDPVPVTLQGTSSVTGNVTVTNTPSVNVQNEVAVSNSDNPARQPVQIDTSVSFGSNTFLFGTKDDVFTVPAGKRLVIEHVASSFFLGSASASGKGLVAIRVTNPGALTSEQPVGTSSEAVQCTSSQTCVVVARPVRIYADPGARIGVTAMGNISVTGVTNFATVTVNGHLVDL